MYLFFIFVPSILLESTLRYPHAGKVVFLYQSELSASDKNLFFPIKRAHWNNNEGSLKAVPVVSYYEFKMIKTKNKKESSQGKNKLII